MLMGIIIHSQAATWFPILSHIITSAPFLPVCEFVHALQLIRHWLINSITLCCVCELLPCIVKMSSHLLGKHGSLIKWNIFFFTALDYALLHSLSAANNSDNLAVRRYTILIIWWWTLVLQLSHYSIILFLTTPKIRATALPFCQWKSARVLKRMNCSWNKYIW